MSNPSARALRVLTDRTSEWTYRAYVPFSQKPVAALILLEDGSWIPGVRVESASYSLAISALLNAYTTMMCVRPSPIAAICLSRPFRDEEIVFSERIAAKPVHQATPQILVAGAHTLPRIEAEPVSPFLQEETPRTPAEGIRLARQLTERAFVPESDFPVAAVIETEDGQLIPGVNVENSDWTHILCAERNALGTAVTFGVERMNHLYLTCSRDTTCSPCGACRQLLTELTPTIRLWMDRGSNPEEPSTPERLLPASFTGQTLFNKLTQS